MNLYPLLWNEAEWSPLWLLLLLTCHPHDIFKKLKFSIEKIKTERENWSRVHYTDFSGVKTYKVSVCSSNGENIEKEQNVHCYLNRLTCDCIMILITKSDLTECLPRHLNSSLTYKNKNKSKDLQVFNLKWLKVCGLLTRLMHREKQKGERERKKGIPRCKMKKEAHQWHLWPGPLDVEDIGNGKANSSFFSLLSITKVSFQYHFQI